MKIKYKIHTLSARAIISFAKQKNNIYSFNLDKKSTQQCVLRSSADEQDDNALFYQIMCILYGNDFVTDEEAITRNDLQDVIFYIDFNRIFDNNNFNRYKKAEDMFRPEGINLDLGNGIKNYVAFERSGSMSRQARLSFVRSDIYDELQRRIMLDMTVEYCQLSKLYAYKGLMLSSGTRIDKIGLTKPHRVIVIDNHELTSNSRVITVKGDSINEATKKYTRVEDNIMFKTIRYDGEGLISTGYAKTIDEKFCGEHTHHSFQIRMPFVKGMLHEVDFKDFLLSSGTEYIKDIWGVRHPVAEVSIILTKSMFKGYGWLKDNNMSWDDYLEKFKKYNHALYITNVSKVRPENHTKLNYQFLNTLQMTSDEFRPTDLPDGWSESPEKDSREWITKATEQKYYELCCDENSRVDFFINKGGYVGRCLKKNYLLVNEKRFVKELSDTAEHILTEYSLGRLIVKGDNRFLSDDLLDLLISLIDVSVKRNKRQDNFYTSAILEQFDKTCFYAPAMDYEADKVCTLLRNPHIARNEEIQLNLFGKTSNMRKYYLSHLTDVVMVDPLSLAAHRLGGADFDGDMIKTIADSKLNECVRRNYDVQTLDNYGNLPLLYIPTEEPVIRNANSWHDRFVTVRDTFSSRVGQICNAAFDRSIVAYDENSDSAERNKCREETETLAILTGLEIDSAKSGVKPDLSEYLEQSKRAHNTFLQYKILLDDDGDRAWYEPTLLQKKKSFLSNTDWNEITSNVERLPYLAEMLKKHTKRLLPKPVSDSELFTFAKDTDWKDKLDTNILAEIQTLISDYEACLSRIRSCRVAIRNRKKQNDINRILFSRGQEEIYDTDTLYADFSKLSAQRVSELRSKIINNKWQLLDKAARREFLEDNIPEYEDYFDLLTDFRFGGYRVLGDLICDIDDENTATERKQFHRPTDSTDFTSMMEAYENKSYSQSYREAVATRCKELLSEIIKPKKAVMYIVAIEKRELLWDIIPECIESNLRTVRRNAKRNT